LHGNQNVHIVQIQLYLRKADSLRPTSFDGLSAPGIPLPPAATAPHRPTSKPLKIPSPPGDGPTTYDALPSGPTNQFAGDIKVATWNSQALFARKARRHLHKMQEVNRLSQLHDALLVTETHGKPGEELTLSLPRGWHAWWAHGSATRAGVAILISPQLRAQFDDSLTRWEVITPGRAAVLRLKGAQGCLDLWVTYFATGKQGEIQTSASCNDADSTLSITTQRRNMRESIATRISPRNNVLTIIAGDFNWVAQEHDRCAIDALKFTGKDDVREEQHWQQLIEDRSGLFEMHQPCYTCDTGHGRSRLDRVYTNYPVVDQLDKTIAAVALKWCPALSAHRALSFIRRTKSRTVDSTKPISIRTIQDPSWPMQTALIYHEMGRMQGKEPTALGNLRRIKEAMHEASRRIDSNRAQREQNEEDQDDQLGWAMRALRAAEKHRWGSLDRCVRKLPRLAEITQGNPARCATPAGLGALRDLAYSLAKEHIVTQLQEMQSKGKEGEAEHSDLETRNLRGRIHQQVRKLKPGTGSAIAAVCDEHGEVTTEPSKMADILRDHWKEVFSPSHTEDIRLTAWMREEKDHLGGDWGLPPPNDPEWQLTKQDIRKAIRTSPNTAAGPDGIPFAAWRRLGGTGENILADVARTLQSDEGCEKLQQDYATPEEQVQGTHSYNRGLLVLLPKKPTGAHAELGEYYAAGDTRPLSIVNCDNRLLANAVRIRVEPIFETWISSMQQGFLPGRSLLSNVMDVDHALRSTAVSQQNGAGIFFDFRAAFPSLSHKCLHKVLEELPVPAWLRAMVKALYDHNHCDIIAGGQRHAGFQMGSGIRQGCPLSPLLFALVADLLLRRLQRKLEGATIRAYADDIAIVVPDLHKALPMLAETFAQYASFSGLELNMHKTYLIPLGDDKWKDTEKLISDTWPSWVGIKVGGHATYLGFVLGPTAGETSWVKALRKFRERAAQWGQLGLSMAQATVVYNTYVITVLSFLIQLLPLPSCWASEEHDAFKKLIPGPYRWCIPTDLHQLKHHWKMPYSFRNLHCQGEAAKMRVLYREARLVAGMGAHRKSRQLREARTASTHLTRCARLRTWLDAAMSTTLVESSIRSQARGITIATVETKLAGNMQLPLTKARHTRILKGVQAMATDMWDTTERGNHEARLRHKLDRWQIAVLPNIRTSRATRLLAAMPRHIPPRCIAAIMRTWYNGWCTQRRFQGGPGHCLFGNCEEAEDSIEHYSVCPALAQLANRFLGIQEQGGDLKERRARFLLLHEARPSWEKDGSEMTRRTLHLAAAYRVHCACRHAAGWQTGQAMGAYGQAVKHMVRGSKKLISLVDNIWVGNHPVERFRDRPHHPEI
jgi:exonuclease III